MVQALLSALIVLACGYIGCFLDIAGCIMASLAAATGWIMNPYKVKIFEEEIMTGEMIPKLADGYKAEADVIKEKYTGEEYEKRMGTLNEAFDELASQVEISYGWRINDALSGAEF